MTPDIRLEFRMKVKAGPQTIGVAFLQKAHAANEDLVRRPVSSTYDVFIGMQYGYTTAPHLSRVVITGPYNATGLGDTPSRRRVFVVPARIARPTKGAVRKADHLDARAPRVSTCAGRGGSRAAARLLSGRARQDRQLRGRHRDGAAPHPRRSGVHLPLRADAGRSRPLELPYRISDTELASRLSFFLWSSHSGRGAAEAGDRRQAAPAGRARAADAPHARGPEGASAGHQLRQPVAVPARAEERQSRRHDLPGLRRQPASGLPARDRAAVRERHARGPIACSISSTRTTPS